jgi:hypothetical protein
MAYWWCLKHSRVEGDQEDRAENRLGPYDTEEAARGALSAVHDRNERLDAEDEQWREKGAQPPSS